MTDINLSVCYRCGGSTYWGYEIRDYGTVESDTGYRDSEVVCHACLGDDDEAFYEVDQEFTARFEEGDL